MYPILTSKIKCNIIRIALFTSSEMLSVAINATKGGPDQV